MAIINFGYAGNYTHLAPSNYNIRVMHTTVDYLTYPAQYNLSQPELYFDLDGQGGLSDRRVNGSIGGGDSYGGSPIFSPVTGYDAVSNSGDITWDTSAHPGLWTFMLQTQLISGGDWGNTGYQSTIRLVPTVRAMTLIGNGEKLQVNVNLHNKCYLYRGYNSYTSYPNVNSHPACDVTVKIGSQVFTFNGIALGTINGENSNAYAPSVFTADRNDELVFEVDPPFTDPMGTVTVQMSIPSLGLSSPEVECQPPPFFVFDEQMINDAHISTTGMQTNGMIGLSQSFGFKHPVANIRSNSNTFYGANPAFEVSWDKDQAAFQPEMFMSSNYPSYRITDTGGNYAEMQIPTFTDDNRENTQLLAGVPFDCGCGDLGKPQDGKSIGFKMKWIQATWGQPGGGQIDHFALTKCNNEILTNYMFPSSVFLPDHTWRIMAYNRAEKRYEVYSTAIKEGEGGFMGIAWPVGYFGAHMTRLLDGTLCTMAWSYQNSSYSRLYFKKSPDNGATWGDIVPIFGIGAAAFQSSWVITQDTSTGAIYIGNYISFDMGGNWQVKP